MPPPADGSSTVAYRRCSHLANASIRLSCMNEIIKYKKTHILIYIFNQTKFLTNAELINHKIATGCYSNGKRQRTSLPSTYCSVIFAMWRPSITRGSLDPKKSTPKRHLERFSCFLEVSPMCLTHRHIPRYVKTCVGIARIYHCLQCWRCGLIIVV